ncbi:MAG: hypothetical protein LUQ15_08405 [Methanothrix sp.]|nr:hypothetical protein [Methanothrix sp.]
MAKLGQAFAAIFFGIIFLTVLPSNFIFPEFAELAASIHLLIALFVVGAIERS